MEVIELEEFAFELLDDLTDNYDFEDGGVIAKAIQEENTPEGLGKIIRHLQHRITTEMGNSFEVNYGWL